MKKGHKIDREFQLSDSTVNVYGFRLLTEGYLAAEYEKNPIGYMMHLRDSGVLLRWENIRIEDDKVYAKPTINLSHPRAQQTIDEVENGFLNAASVGHLVILEYSDDQALKLPGQTGPTVTKWFNRECSLCDIPGNMNALALYDKHDNEINLADFSQSKPFMKQLILTATMLSSLNLKADSTEFEVNQAFSDLVAKAQKSEALQLELNNLKADTIKKEVEAILKTAEAEKKITVQLSAKLAIDYASNPTGLKDLLTAMPVTQSIVAQINAGNQQLSAGLKDRSWDELHTSGKLADLKAADLDTYNLKFKEKFGTEPSK